MVGLVHEPLNTHDPNAIEVLNTCIVQVGHIGDYNNELLKFFLGFLSFSGYIALCGKWVASGYCIDHIWGLCC